MSHAHPAGSRAPGVGPRASEAGPNAPGAGPRAWCAESTAARARAHAPGRGLRAPALASGGRPGPAGESRPQTVIVKFAKFADRQYVLQNSLMLKGTNIFVNEDLCEATMQAKKAQLPALRLARDLGKIAHFIRSRLVIGDRKVHPQASDGSSSQSASDRVSGAATPSRGGVAGASVPTVAATTPIQDDVAGASASAVGVATPNRGGAACSSASAVGVATPNQNGVAGASVYVGGAGGGVARDTGASGNGHGAGTGARAVLTTVDATPGEVQIKHRITRQQGTKPRK